MTPEVNASHRRIISESKRQVLFVPEALTKNASKDLVARWTWADEGQGLVTWTFENNSTTTKTGILLRNSYFFGGAFWPVYVANAGFGVDWATALTPLVDSGVSNNAPPIGIVDIGTNKPEVCFLFTLAPGQAWSMYEGGFSTAVTPSGIAMYDVTLKRSGQFCVGYDQQRVIDWDLQTQTTLQGYSPNPSTVQTVQVVAESDTPYDVLPFNDPVPYVGQCQGGSASQPPQSCEEQIGQGFDELSRGQTEQGIIDIVSGIECIVAYLEQSGSATIKIKKDDFLRYLENKLKRIEERLTWVRSQL